jgi:hypothetical protein
MFELFQRARWDQAYDFLASGDPPMIFRLLAINTIFLVFYIIRRARVSTQMRPETMIQVQVLLILANILILFQRDIMRMIDRFI